MKGDSRVQKSLLNARVNLICYVVALIVAFFSRQVFFDFLGAEFLGLTETIKSFLGFFNLAESGVGIAIAFLLYKPIFDGDEEQINELISVFGYLYRLIGIFIFTMSVLFSLSLPVIFPETSFSFSLIYFVYYASVFSSLLGYFVNYPQILLSADQRNYEVTGYYQIITVAQTIAQIALIYLVKNYYVFISLQILFSLFYSLILYWRIRKIYPWLHSEIKLGRALFKKYPDIWKKVKQIFIHKIGGFAHYQLIPLLIYGYVSLPVVALYNNYTLIGKNLNALVNAVLGSTSAGVGSLIAEGDKGKILSVYEKLFAIDMIVAGVVSASIYHLSSPFISLWLGSQYVMEQGVVLLVALEFFFGILRLSTDQFIQGSGLFSDIWSPIAEIVILVLTSVVFGSLWGIMGILLGPIFSVIVIIYIWKPYFLFKRGFKLPVFYYWSIFIKNFFAFVSAYWVSFQITRIVMGNSFAVLSWTSWIVYSLVFTMTLLSICTLFISIVAPNFRKLLRESWLKVYTK